MACRAETTTAFVETERVNRWSFRARQVKGIKEILGVGNCEVVICRVVVRECK